MLFSLFRVATEPGTWTQQDRQEEAGMVRLPNNVYQEPGREEENGESRLRCHLLAAYTIVKGEHQLAEYVARLDLGECARILAASPMPLSTLVARDPASRVDADEERGFEEIIRAWTLRVLSGIEGD